MERDSIRKIVLAEIALFKSENFNSQEGEGPISKLETLEVLTRPEVYNASPDAIQKSIDNEFKEVTGLNSTIAATFLMGLGMGCSCGCGCCDDDDDEDLFAELATADEETKKEFQFMTDFLGFLADNPAAFGMGDETQVGEAFGKLKESFANQDGTALKEGLEKFQEIIMGGIHSCVKVYVDSVDLSAETVVFDFVDDAAQKEFCEYFKVPVKSESMVMATGCRFRNGLPKAGREYLLNIVELENEVTFEEVTDHAVIGLKVDLRNITYDPFYDEDGDDDGDDSFFEDDDDPGITPGSLQKVKAFLDSLEGREDNDADYPDGGGSDPSDVDGNFYLILGGIPVAAASAGSDSWPAEYLYSDGSLKDSMLDDIEAKVLSLPEINSEGEIEINVPFIEKKLEGQKFATVDTYKRSFVDTAKRGLVVFDYDFDNERFIWVARPKNLVDTSLLHGDTLSVDDDFGNPVESFYVTEMVREVRP